METIKSSTEISELFSKGRRVKTPYLTLIASERKFPGIDREAKQHDPRGRVAFIAGKKLGNAVWRNAAKRRMRALCRDLGGAWRGYDVIFLAKSPLTSASYSKVLEVCGRALDRSFLNRGEE